MSEEKPEYAPLYLRVDPLRFQEARDTGILVRAEFGGKMASVDIAVLDRESLFKWLRSCGGSNLWAENTCAILLGHKPEELGRS